MTAAKRVSPDARLRVLRSILRDLDHPMFPGAAVLDFGCGEGEMVSACRAQGFLGFGCDVVLADPTETLRRIEAATQRIPFDDESFDFVVSDQVIEHVKDHDRAFAEIRRVLKPDGAMLHVFPSRWRLREAHVYVPLAGALQQRAWLALWALLGVRNEFQSDKDWRAVVEANATYLSESTRYLTTAELRRALVPHFPRARFVEHLLIRHSPGRARALAPLVDRAPWIATIYRECHARAVFAPG